MNLLCFFGFHKEPNKKETKELLKKASYDKYGYTLVEYKCKRCKHNIKKWYL